MMTHPWLVLLGIAALAAVYVLLPVVGDAFRRFRASRMLVCPKTGTAAQVAPDAAHAALTAAYGRPRVRIARCSLWPERQGCDQDCRAQVEAESVAVAGGGRPG
jgi:hypothetical protein